MSYTDPPDGGRLDAGHLARIEAAMGGRDPDDLPPTGEQPRPFWDRRELFAWCRDMGAARLVPPAMILAEILARARVAAGHRLAVPPIVGAAAPLNIGFILAGGTGGGKTTAAAIAEDAGLTVHTAGLGTAEGIAAQYGEAGKDGAMEYKRRGVLFTSDEAEGALAVAARPGNAVMPAIRTLISGATLTISYRSYPVNLKRGEYAAAIIIAGQPVKLAPLLTGDEIAGGTPQRFLWLPGGYRDCPEPGQPAPGPAPIRLPPVEKSRGHIAYPPAVWDEVRRNRVAELRGTPDALDSHLMLTRLKLAAILAVTEQRTVVEPRDWDDAGELVRVSQNTVAAVRAQAAEHDRTRTRAQGTAEGHRLAAADGVREAAARGRIARRIADHVHDHAAGGGCVRKCVRGYLAARDRGDIDAAADLAAANGWIVPAERDHQRHPGEAVSCWTPGRRP